MFNVVGEVLPATQVERVFRDYYAGRLGNDDLEDLLLRDIDETRFREICQTALEGLATRRLDLELLVEQRARARERRVMPETIARFISDSARYAGLPLRPAPDLPHTFEAGRKPPALRQRAPGTGEIAASYGRITTRQDTAQEQSLAQARLPFASGACFHSLQLQETGPAGFLQGAGRGRNGPADTRKAVRH